jgi:hypothetical protein
MELKDLTPGIVALDLRGKLCVVTEVRPGNRSPIIYKMNAGHTTYKAPVDFFKAVVGSVDLVKFQTSIIARSDPAPDAPLADFFLPAELKGLKPGDPIKIKNRGKLDPAVYLGYNHRSPKNPVRIQMNSKEYRCPLFSVVR